MAKNIRQNQTEKESQEPKETERQQKIRETKDRLKNASKHEDWRTVGILAKEIAELENNERIELEKEHSVHIKTAIENAIKDVNLTKFDGIWYYFDKSTGESGLRLTKAQPVRRTSGRVGESNLPSTDSLMEKFGDETVTIGDKTDTFRNLWATSSDKNWRYPIRKALLKRSER